VAPVRFPFLSESSHAFFLVFGGEEGLEHTTLEEEALRKTQLLRLVNALFADRDRRSRLLGDFLPDLDRLVHELVGGHDA